MDLEIVKKALFLLSTQPDIIKNLPSLPNINFPTMGGNVFWNDLAEINGWRVQRNNITGHCRILDADDVRRAWGGEDAIMDLFNKLLKI